MEGKSALLGLITGAADTDLKREMTHVYKVVFGKNGDDKVAAYGDPVYSARYAQNNAVAAQRTAGGNTRAHGPRVYRQ